jgi:amidophosphoribosyltransferase
MAVLNGVGFDRHIHDITNAQFRSKFETDVAQMSGRLGIGAISDFEDQPLLIGSHLGTYAISTVGAIQNAADLARRSFQRKSTHFAEMAGGEVNPTELVAALVNQGGTFEEGIQAAQDAIEGSCSMLLLTDKGIYAARDKLGRTPLVVGRRDGARAVTLETCALPNLNYELERYLGPGEVVFLTADGVEQLRPPLDRMQICGFLWVYYGFPASSYEGINTEDVRNRCGAALARSDGVEIDFVAGIPDSGTGHAIGYAVEAGLPYRRPFVKYTPTWPRSFMPQDQSVRNLVAQMKLIPIRELIQGQKILFCEDSIVRGTQLTDIIERLYDYGAEQVHMRPACPPLVFGCKFLNFSRSRSEMDLAARTAIKKLDGNGYRDLDQYSDSSSDKHCAMVDLIRERLKLTSLQYQKLDDLVDAIGLPKEKICTYCWDGAE